VKCPRSNLLPHYAATLAQLAQTGEALELDGGDPAFDLAATNGHSRLTNEERQTLLELKSTLLLPLKTKDAMPGVVALGSRLGDLPFSAEDKRLLQSSGRTSQPGRHARSNLARVEADESAPVVYGADAGQIEWRSLAMRRSRDAADSDLS